jgi:hypothetical protein
MRCRHRGERKEKREKSKKIEKRKESKRLALAGARNEWLALPVVHDWLVAWRARC